MKKINKILLILFITILVTGCGSKKEEKDKTPDDKKEPTDIVYLFDHEYYKNLTLEEVESIEEVKITIGGDARKQITGQAEIEQLYNVFKNTKLGEKTEMTCEDNTTIYNFIMKNGDKYSVTFECDWIIIGKERYTIAK